MSVKIPTYDAHLTPSGLLNARATGTESSSAVGNAMQRLGSSIGNIEDAWQQKENDQAIANTGRQLAESDSFWKQRQQALAESSFNGGQVKDADGNVVSMTDAVRGEFSKWRDDFLGGVRNPKARLFAEQHINSMQSQVEDSTIRTEANLRYQNKVSSVRESNRQYAQMAAENPDLAPYLISNSKLLIANVGLDEQTRNAEALTAEKQINDAAAVTKMMRDPSSFKAAIDQKFGGNPAGGFDSAIDFTLKHEIDPRDPNKITVDNNGAKVKYGINFKGNPDVDLSKLDLAGAKQIYKERYWDKIGGDELAAQNPALARVAFDTAVLASPRVAKDLLAQSGGDVQKFMDLREQFLAGLTKQDSAKYGGAVAKNWAKRNADLRQNSTNTDPVLTSIVDQMTPEQAYRFRNEAGTEINRQQAVYRSQLSTVEGDHMAMYARGETPQRPLAEGDYTQAYGPIEGSQRFANYQANAQVGSDMNAMKLMPTDQMDATVARYKPDATQPGYESAAKRYEMIATARDNLVAARQADPMDYAIRNKIADAKPLDFNDMASLGTQLAQRAGVAQTMNQEYRAPLSLLTKQEAATLNQGFQNMSYQQRLGYLDTLRTNVTNPQAYSSLLQQIAPDHPVVAAAGILLNNTAFQWTTGWLFKDRTVYDPSKVARDMLYGEALLNPYKATKESDGIGKNFQMPANADAAAMNQKLTNVVGNAFADQPDAFRNVNQMARAYYAAQMARQGQFDGKYDENVWTDSIRAVTGGVADVNGKSVVIPYGMGEDTFRSTLRAKFDEQMKAHGMADQFSSARFMNAGNGRFKVLSGTGPVYDKTGNPILVDLSTPPVPARFNTAPAAPSVVQPDKTGVKHVATPSTKSGR